MKWIYRTAAVLMCLCLLIPAGCRRNGDDDVITLKVWGSGEDQAMLGEMIEAFKKSRTDDGKTYNITLGVVGEDEAKTRVLEDPAAAGDLFAFSDDQLIDLHRAGALYEITRNKATITTENSEGSVQAASVGEALYAYPVTADNGYFLYYDSRVLSAEDVKTLDGLLAAANTAGKRVYMDVSNGWYNAAFFLGAGCKLGLDDKGKQTCDFNNTRGIQAGEAIKAFCADPAFVTGNDAVLTGGIGNTICAGISGTWNADAIKEKLGSGYAAVKLPTFTCGGVQVQMASFAGYKLLGVNASTKHPVEAMELAEFLTNEENQIKRFETRAMGPSNLKAAASEAVKSNVALAALAQQNVHGVTQREVLSSTWDPLEAFGTAMEAKDYTRTVESLLNTMVQQITA